MRPYEKEPIDPAKGPPLPAPFPWLPHHPEAERVERFMRGELTKPESRAVVRHLLTRCPRCLEVASRLWSLGTVPRQTGGRHD
jgi:hypothetical protein